ncbi:MAG: hypothetical protein ACKOFW_19140, partial [Planctomycetaceae bacterium]
MSRTWLSLAFYLAFLPALSFAQGPDGPPPGPPPNAPPGDGPGPGPGPGGPGGPGPDGPGGPGPGQMLRMLPLMKSLDANGDGVISAEEIENAAAALKKLDKNGDGKLSDEELRP